MAKKSNTRRSDGLIAVQVYLGQVDGKRKYKTVYGATQKEADEKAFEVKLLLRKGIDVTASQNTFGDWSNRLMAIKKHEVSFTWYATLVSYLKHYQSIEHIQLDKLRSADFQALIYQLSEKGLSRKTLNQIKSFASQVYRLAIDNRVADYDPVISVKLPKEIKSQTRRALTQEEQSWIINAPHRARTPAMIMMFAGLRRGEVIPLTWSDIDLENKTISVNKSVEMLNGKSHKKDGGKTSNATRIVHIPQILVDYLSNIAKTNFLVCTSAKGTMLSESAWDRMWESYIKNLNFQHGDFSNYIDDKPKSKFDPKGVPFVIPRITSHWLRHTFATMLYMAGVDVLTAKEELGHSDIKTTLNIYTHLDTAHKAKNISKLDDYLSEGVKKSV